MVIHFMHYALSAYGWPMFLMTHSKTGMCQLCTKVRCCCFSCCRSNKETADIIDDNCCYCNYAAMKRMLKMTEAEVVYTTFHVDVGESLLQDSIDLNFIEFIQSWMLRLVNFKMFIVKAPEKKWKGISLTKKSERKRLCKITKFESICLAPHNLSFIQPFSTGETPFFVAVDYKKEKIVVSIRGTLSMKDVLTDLNAEGEVLPLEPRRDDWVGHKGMVQAAVYIRNKLEDENLLQRAQQHNLERKTDQFGLVIVGHSLGAGTAAILSIMLKPQFQNLLCYSYSPPGGKCTAFAIFHTHWPTK